MDPKKAAAAQQAHDALRAQFDQANLHALETYARLMQRLGMRRIRMYNLFMLPGA
jgi:hypothetical protein